MKICVRCGQEKEFTAFSKDRYSRDGHCRKCKQCRREVYLETREEVAATSRIWYEANKSSHNRKSLEYYHSRPHERSEVMAEWYRQNKEHVAQSVKSYREARPGFVTEKQARRRANLLRAMPLWADRQAIDAIYAEAARLTQESGVLHVVDHVYPLQSKRVCGLHIAANLQVLTAKQNAFKGAERWPGHGWCNILRIRVPFAENEVSHGREGNPGHDGAVG
jgi:hypothetical protein